MLLASLLIAAAFVGETPAYPTEPIHGFAFCHCPARVEAEKVHVAVFSTKPTADQGPIFVCDCEYDGEELLADPTLESVCSAWAPPQEFGGVLLAPECMAQTYMTDTDHRHFGPCDASCTWSTPIPQSMFTRAWGWVKNKLGVSE